MPVVLLKTATKQLQEGFQAARQRLSIGSNSFSDRGDRTRKFGSKTDSFSFDDLDSSHSQLSTNSKTVRYTSPRPDRPVVIAESSRELHEGESTTRDDDDEKWLSPTPARRRDEASEEFDVHEDHKRVSFPGFLRIGRTSDVSMDESIGPRMHFFRKTKQSSDLSMDDVKPDSASRMSSFFARKPSSSMEDTKPESSSRVSSFFGRKQSNVSDMSTDGEDEPARTSLFRQKSDEFKRRVPSIFRSLTSPLKRSSDHSKPTPN